jgi:hypothetical protein
MHLRADNLRLTSKFVFVFLSALACGSPEDLGDGFPPLDQTGYDDNGSGGSPTGGAGTGSVLPPPGGAGGTPGQGGTGSLPPPGGAGGSPGGAGPVGGTGGGNPGGAGPGGAGGGEPPVAGCPDDISELFARPITEGGCDGQGCHIPGPTGTPPDLVSPNPVERLLNVQSSCGGRPYVGADDSFLIEKITSSDPECDGAAMPFFMPAALSAEDEACIIAWAAQVSGN